MFVAAVVAEELSRGTSSVADTDAHARAQFPRTHLRDLLLGGENVVQIDARNVAAHHVEDIRGDLAARVGQLVVRLIGVLAVHLVLHGDARHNKDVVLRLGLALHVELLHAQRQGAHHLLAEGAVDAVAARLPVRAGGRAARARERALSVDSANASCADAFLAHAHAPPRCAHAPRARRALFPGRGACSRTQVGGSARSTRHFWQPPGVHLMAKRPHTQRCCTCTTPRSKRLTCCTRVRTPSHADTHDLAATHATRTGAPTARQRHASHVIAAEGGAAVHKKKKHASFQRPPVRWHSHAHGRAPTRRARAQRARLLRPAAHAPRRSA